MGRPRKYPESPVVVPDIAPPVPDADPDGAPTPEELEEMEPGQLVSVALDWPRMKLTPAMLTALNETWRDVCRADDDEGKSLARRIVSRLRRCGHAELHPGCTRVTIDVPVLKRQDGRGGVWYVRINDRTYVGKCDVWECEARTILELVYHYRQVEHDRMSDDNHMIDLDTGGMVAERARAIQRA
jgi:hypothetical protein